MESIALLGVGLIFAKIFGGIVEKWGIPSVLAELLTGVMIGNLGGPLGGFVRLESSETVRILSEMGVLILLFTVGLETNVKEIRKVGIDAGLVATLGVVAPFLLAFATLPFLFAGDFNQNLFMASVLTATSVGITARVLRDAGKLTSISGQIILGAAVIDDILGIIVLAVVTGIVAAGAFSLAGLGLLLIKILAFIAGAFLVRQFILPPFLRSVRRVESGGTITVLLFSLCFIAAWLAEKSGLAGIVGAFALGLALDDVHFKGFRATKEQTLEELVRPTVDFLVPIFFIHMGMKVKIAELLNPQALSLAAVLIVCATIGKLVCGWGVRIAARRRGADRLLVGLGMIPRGEVGLIFAATGIQRQIIHGADYSAVVAMVAVTTLLSPILIGWRLRRN